MDTSKDHCFKANSLTRDDHSPGQLVTVNPGVCLLRFGTNEEQWLARRHLGFVVASGLRDNMDGIDIDSIMIVLVEKLGLCYAFRQNITIT